MDVELRNILARSRLNFFHRDIRVVDFRESSPNVLLDERFFVELVTALKNGICWLRISKLTIFMRFLPS